MAENIVSIGPTDISDINESYHNLVSTRNYFLKMLYGRKKLKELRFLQIDSHCISIGMILF